MQRYGFKKVTESDWICASTGAVLSRRSDASGHPQFKTLGAKYYLEQSGYSRYKTDTLSDARWMIEERLRNA